MKTNRQAVSTSVFCALTAIIAATSALAGCGNQSTVAAPSGLEAQQKSVMGGTPPPGAMAEVRAEQAAAAQRMAAGQAAAQASAKK